MINKKVENNEMETIKIWVELMHGPWGVGIKLARYDNRNCWVRLSKLATFLYL